jgi:hypothetical protein
MKRFRLLMVLIGVAVMIAGGVVLVPVTASAAGPTYVDVSSTHGWQQTPVTLHRGDKVSLWYETGSWTVDHVNFPYVGPDGYSSAVDQKIYQGCKLNPQWVYGLMLGRVGDGPTVVVGRSATLTADRDGPLQLRIHDGDACLGDNAGAIRMEYSVQASPAAYQPRIYWSQIAGPQTVSFTLTGNGWQPNGTVNVQVPYGSKGIFYVNSASWQADSYGEWQQKVTVGPTPPGTYKIIFSEPSAHLQVSGNFKVTLTHPQLATVVADMYKIQSAQNAINTIIAGKAWTKTTVSKATTFIDKAMTVFYEAKASWQGVNLGNDLAAFNRALARAHGNTKDPTVKKAASKVAGDCSAVWNTLLEIVPGLDFILPPPVS